jgi:hypothetical protein
MAYEHIEQQLNNTRAVRLTLVVKPPQGKMNARMSLDMADAKGKSIIVAQLGATPTEAEMLERAQRLTEFLLQRGFKILHQDPNTTVLERPPTADDEITFQQRLLNAFGDMPPSKLQVYQSATIYEVVFSDQRINLGHLTSDESSQLHDWLPTQGFTKIKTATEDFRYGEFTYYYERVV